MGASQKYGPEGCGRYNYDASKEYAAHTLKRLDRNTMDIKEKDMEKRFIKRLAALGCAAAISLSLFTGCGPKAQNEPSNNGGSSQVDIAGGGNGGSQSEPSRPGGNQSGGGNAARPADAPEFVYVPNFSRINADVDYIGAFVPAGDHLYFTSDIGESIDPEGNVLTEEDEDYWTYYTYRTAIYTMSLDGSGVHELENYKAPEIPEGKQGSSYLSTLTVDAAGNLAVVENTSLYHYDAPEGVTEESEDYWNYYVDDGSTSILRTIDGDGNELSSFDLASLSDEDYFYVNNLLFGEDGTLYVNAGNAVYVLDQELKLSFKVEMDNWIERMIQLSDGSVAASGYGNSGYCVKCIDRAAKAWGKEIKLPMNLYNVFSGKGDYLVYGGDGNNLWGYDGNKDEWVKILNWIDSDVDGNNLNVVLPTEDGNITAISQSWTENGQKIELIKLVKTPWDQVPHKTTLTYACAYLDWNLRGQIIEFNRTNPDYRISVKDYSEYNTEEDYSAGLTKLTTEIVTGNVPDLLSISSIPIDQYAAKGLLEDLYPYMDADSDVTRASFIPSVLRALETDGKLYKIGNTFSVMTVFGNPRQIGYEPGWTLDELNAAMNKLEPGADVFDSYMTRDNILNQAMAFNMSELVDWNTGRCDFGSEGFIKLLEFANRFPAEFNWDNYEYETDGDTPTRLRQGKQLLVNTSLSDFNSFQMYKAMFGGEVVMKGFPCESRNGNALQMDSGIAMTTSCRDKQGAWSFIRSLLTEDYQKENVTWNFPTNQAAFDAMLKEAMTPTYETDPETGERVEQPKNWYGWGSMEIKIYALTQEEADQIKNTINSVNRLYFVDQSIMNIINDEAAAFFNGQRSARDCANYIQSRVNIYVNEQR